MVDRYIRMLRNRQIFISKKIYWNRWVIEEQVDFNQQIGLLEQLRLFRNRQIFIGRQVDVYEIVFDQIIGFC